MTPRELVYRTLEFDRPPAVPRQAWILPWAEERHPDAVALLKQRYPDDLVAAERLCRGPLPDDNRRYRPGSYVDEWGCLFENPESGIIGIVRRPLVADWSQLDNVKPPGAFLDLDREAINAFCRGEDRFVIAGTWIRPFERLQFIRTMEQALADLLEQPPGLHQLLHAIHEFYLKEAEAWARTEVDAIAVMDDWGSQSGLLASPEIFRRLFKPLYREYAEIARHYGKKIFMHSDGHILEIFPDLIEVGFNAINAQIFCMGLAPLARFRGRITFWGEIDRQNLLPYGSAAEIDRAVHQVHASLWQAGGLIAQCEFGPGARPENVLQVFRSWEEVGGRGGAR